VLLASTHSFEILTKLGIKSIRNQLRVLSRAGVALSVQEPFWDVVINGISQDIIDGLNLIFGQLTSALVNINLSLSKDKGSDTSTNTFDLTKTIWGLLLSIQVSVLNTKNVVKLIGVLQN
jgi:hypothetical protein